MNSNKPGKNQGDGLRRVLAVLKHHLSNCFAAAPFLQPAIDDGELRNYQYLAGELLKQLEQKHGFRARLVVPMMMHANSTKAVIQYLEAARQTKTAVQHAPSVVEDLKETPVSYVCGMCSAAGGCECPGGSK